MINLNILNYAINKKLKIKDFSVILKNILSAKTNKFPIDGEYLIRNGMQQGAQIGKVLKKVEQEWIKNDFKISKDQVKDIISSNLN